MHSILFLLLAMHFSFARSHAHTEPGNEEKNITLKFTYAHCTLHICVNKSMQAMNRIVIYIIFFRSNKKRKDSDCECPFEPKPHTRGEHFLCVWHIFSILIACHKFQKQKKERKTQYRTIHIRINYTGMKRSNERAGGQKTSKTKTRMNKSMERSLTVIHLICG